MTMTTTMLNLPKDLKEEIISRVPLKSMRAVKLTCKNWNSLYKSRSFMKLHIGKEEAASTELGESSRMIVTMGYNLYSLSVVQDNEIDHPSTELRGKLTCLEEQVKVNQVFNCEGLLLCILEDDPRVVVWNPYFGQTRWIAPRFTYIKESNTYALGYVNKKNKTSRSHKILRFIDDFYDYSWYGIYDFDTDSWRSLYDATPHLRTVEGDGVSLKGNTYWCARERWRNSREEHAICFDFTKERFGPLLSLPFSNSESNVVKLCCVREVKLAVLRQGYSANMNDINIWITTKIEVEKLLWNKFLTLNLHQVSIQNIFISESFYIDEEKKFVMAFNTSRDPSNRNKVSIIGEDGYFRELYLGVYAHPKCRPHVYSYVPSANQATCRRQKETTKQFRKASV